MWALFADAKVAVCFDDADIAGFWSEAVSSYNSSRRTDARCNVGVVEILSGQAEALQT